MINLPVPVDKPVEEDCGRCVACMTTCPTGAIVEPYTVDARRCISYLTIELDSAIPEEFRPLMGNRIYGCDDCQLICPWNRFSQLTDEDDFSPRKDLHTPELLDLFSWDEKTFLKVTEGSAIRRIGYIKWLRNISVALGNAPYQDRIVLALQNRLGINEMLDEHFQWSIQQQLNRRDANQVTIQTSQQKRLVRAINKGLPRDA
ncbi:Epoxyqueuosine reductase [Providencia rettgeri]|uniref:Epoxyqueuosine reductase n=1 Tax=Providencia rettgeri TaxID=587 RepID=A0A379FXI6_PRORE|nr:Epoxyqueuosine reductase [Providencia rettgeri]